MYPRLTDNLEPLEVQVFSDIPVAGTGVDFQLSELHELSMRLGEMP
jgi:hypothetical protein